MSCNQLIAGAAGYLPMQETGAVTSITGGTVTGSTPAAMTEPGPGDGWLNAFDFDAGQYVNTTATLAAQSNWSIAFRLKVNTFTAGRVVLQHLDGGGTGRSLLRLTTSGGGGLDTFLGNSAAALYSPLSTGTWYSCVLTYAHGSPGTMKLWVDGSEVASISRTAEANPTGALRLAEGKTGSGLDADIVIAGVIIDDAVWGSTEVAEYVAGLEPTNTVAPSLSDDGDFSAGSWDSWGNGSLLYTVLLIDDGSDEIVATLLEDSVSTSGNCLAELNAAGTGEYRLLVTASNDGGPSEANSNAILFVYSPPSNLNDSGLPPRPLSRSLSRSLGRSL